MSRRRSAARERVPGRGLSATSVITTNVIQPLADLNGSHAFNEDWPEHAHFHDLAAIGMLEICCATSLYLLRTRRGDPALNTAVAAVLPAAFSLPFFPAHLVSGSSLDATTAHHRFRNPRIGRFTIYPNATIAVVQLGVLLAGWRRSRARGGVRP